MKKIKKFLISALSLVIICQLAGTFSVVRIFAKDAQENSDNVGLQEEGTGALEEEAADDFSNQNPENLGMNLLPAVGNSAPQGTPKGGSLIAAGAPPVYDIVINEFMANPSGSDSGNEWVELYNKEDDAVNISGWKIYDLVGLRATITSGTIIHAKGYYLISGISNLNNSGAEKIELQDQAAQIIDLINYNGATSGESEGRFPDGSSSFHKFSNPTPGAPNYLGQPTAGEVNDGPDVGIDIDFSNNDSSLSANWSGFSDSIVGLDHYEYAVGTTAGDDDVVSWTVDSLDTSVTIVGLSLSEDIYYFSVKAVNKNGIESSIATSNGVTIDITHPEIDDATFNSPDGSPIGPGSQVEITVFLVNPEVGEANGSYNNKNLNWITTLEPLIGPIYEATYTVKAGDLSSTHAKLQVEVTDRAGNTSPLYIEYSGIEIDTTAPSAPLSISVIAGPNNIKINWSASTSPDVVGYNIYRSASPYQKINPSLITGTSYTDSNVEKGVKYSYKITAVDGVGNETALANATASQLISITSVSGVVGQILESAAKTEAAGFIPAAKAAPKKGEVKGEEEVIEEPEEEPPVQEEEDVKNWPMIIAILIAVLIIVAGIWYYWVVTRPGKEYSVISEPESRRKSRRRSAKRSTRRGRRR